MEQTSAIGRAVQVAGGLTSLARMIGVSVPTVHEWKTHKRPVPVSRCIDIERVTQGQVTRRDLRPDDWHRIWPELAPPPAESARSADASTSAAGA